MRRATNARPDIRQPCVISIHALLAESDETLVILPKQLDNFYPRSPCGERRVTVLGIQHKVGISIHALLAESDASSQQERQAQHISIHALLAESDACILIISICTALFLSTLSLRRATNGIRLVKHISGFLSTLSLRRATIILPNVYRCWKFLSTLSLRRATMVGRGTRLHEGISIHALLAESDLIRYRIKAR